MKIKLHKLSYKAFSWTKAKEKDAMTYKKRAWWILLRGFSEAGIYFFA